MATPAAPIIIIFGITGDLSKRKLLPALYHLFRQSALPENTNIIGVSRHDLTPEDLLDDVELCVLETDNVCDPVGIERLKQSLQTIKLQPTEPGDFDKLKATIDELDSDGSRQKLIYMSLPPAAYGPIVENLAVVGLNNPSCHLLLEKPFGYNLASAEELIDLVDKHFPESQVYRIDHYLAKETAQNLLTFRANNPICADIWSSHHIKRVHILAAEQIGIEGRVNFYEQIGALRDFVQSHLMQVLAISLMDVPQTMDSQSIHTAKQKFFSQLLPTDPSEALRGQYDTYRQEVGNDKSSVETYVRLKLQHGNPQWQDTDIILETGKALDRKLSQVAVDFTSLTGEPGNQLIFSLQPDEGIKLELKHKSADLEPLRQAVQAFQPPADAKQLDAYERVILDAIRGDQSLFASAQDVIATWKVLQPLIDAWQANDSDLVIYKSGSAGPQTASD